MNKSAFTLLAVAVLAIGTATSAEAQRRGGGNRMMRMGGGGAASTSMMINRQDVQKDIKLTTDQKMKIDKIMAEATQERQDMMQELRGSGGGGGRPDMSAIRSKFEKMQKKYDDKILAVLDDKQKTRIEQIKLQLSGARILMDSKFQKKLGLKVAQKKKIEELKQAQQDAMQEIFQKMRNQEIERDEVRSLMEKNNKIMDAELLKILTAEQKKKFDGMKGPEFKADPNQGRRGGGGNRVDR